MKHSDDEKYGTRERLLEAASRIFAEKGFRDTTIQDICSAADANVAAVNYHFGSKDNLYLEVWNSVSDVMMKTYVNPLSSISDPEARLKEIVRERVRQTFDEGPAGHLRKLAFKEMGTPTESHDIVVKSFLRPMMNLLTRTVAEIMETSESNPCAQRCAFSLHSQLVFLNVLRMKKKLNQMEFLAGSGDIPTEGQISLLTDHIATFVMGGIMATAKQNGIN